MSKKMPIFYGAMMLTGVNLLLRFVGTSFQVYLSGQIGPEGVGLLQLVLSVSGLALTAGIAGSRTCAMYLCAEDLGQKRKGNVPWVLTGCFLYCLLTGGAVSLTLYFAAPWIAQTWIGNMEAVSALRTFAAFLPLTCLCGVMTGYFTAANRIGTLAVVEVAEQIFCMGVTVLLLLTIPPEDRGGSCRAVVLGTCAGNLLTLGCLWFLYQKERKERTNPLPVSRRILGTAGPLALADDLKAGISATENLMVPKRLALYPGVASPLASFGILTGMVFPVMMFPAAILFSLAEVLIPELARCAAVGSQDRIRYLANRNLRVSLLYGFMMGGGMFLLAESICQWLYPGVGAGQYLRWFALLVPMLYCDLIVDAMTKGLGQQKHCVRYNILSNALDVALLYVLLPRYGIVGYFASFFLTHALNFLLSLRRLIRISRPGLPLSYPCLALSAWLIALFGGSRFTGGWAQVGAFLGLFLVAGYAFGVISPGDFHWLKNLIKPQKSLP
ncbi:MAG: polysaccharide biosynthesis C-terminal domain-containing protein [Oscillospiraceae bacterium]|nr:polysaccharide biosynthesis C-terminal domain-containing protein [Oscillospiraceae bacterium]